MNNPVCFTILTASDAKNLEVAKAFAAKLTSMGHTSNLINLLDLNLPLYSSRNDSQFKPVELLGNTLLQLKDARGFIAVFPEYNGSTPPVLANFIAWVSRASTDWRECFNRKPCAIASYSGGMAANVLLTMRIQFAYLGLNVLGRQLQVNSKKPLDGASLEDLCQQLVKLCN